MIKTPLDLITWAGAVALTIIFALIIVAIAVEVIKQARGLKPKPKAKPKNPGPTSVGKKDEPVLITDTFDKLPNPIPGATARVTTERRPRAPR